jgi:DNA mismatch repair protein MSH3
MSPPKSQATLSSYFPPSPLKKKSSSHVTSRPIDLTNVSDDESHARDMRSPPRKRVRTETTSSYFSQSLAVPEGARSNGGPSTSSALPVAAPSQRWAMGAQDSEPLTSTQAAARRKRHEAFKRILLGPKNPLARSRRLADASSVEELIRLERERQIEDEQEEDGAGAPTQLQSESQRNSPVPQRDDDSDPEFKALLGGFKNKKRGKTADAQKKKQAKKVEEIGPSGEAWTPLELQVLDPALTFALFLNLNYVLGSSTQGGKSRRAAYGDGWLQVSLLW